MFRRKRYYYRKWWKNYKTYIDENGYLRFKDSNKLVHRWVVEKELGHPLPKGAVVHHKNFRKRDNRLSNLRVYSSQGEHEKYHLINRLIPAGIFLFLILLILLLTIRC
jgi:HNH endonuclease